MNLIRELLGNAGDFYWEILRSLDLIVSDRRHVESALGRANERLLPRIPVRPRRFLAPVTSRPVHRELQRFRDARAHFFARHRLPVASPDKAENRIWPIAEDVEKKRWCPRRYCHKETKYPRTSEAG